MTNIPIVHRTDELIKWYVPILNRLPKDYKSVLGLRMVNILYDLQEGFLEAENEAKKLAKLKSLNVKLAFLRYTTGLLEYWDLFDEKKCKYANELMVQIGNQLGGWIRYQEGKEGKEDNDYTGK
jgi:hypothetical protein